MAITDTIPELWSAELLVPYRAARVFSQPGVATTRYAQELLQKGDTYHFPVLQDLSVDDYDESVGLADPETLQAGVITLNIDVAKSFNLIAKTIESAQASFSTISGAIESAGYKMARAQDQALRDKAYAEATAPDGTGGFPDIDTIALADADAVRALFVDAQIAHNLLDAPAEGRWAIAGPRTLGLLQKGTASNNALLSQPVAGAEVIRNGFAGMLGGYQFLMSNYTDEDEIGGTILFGVPEAFAVVDQINRVEGYVHPSFFGEAVRGLFVGGSKVIRPAGIIKATVTF